ncbi:MAG: malate dehydrogenase [Nitrososphaerota archaeon]|nr:malate dehydrogenase [Candidatus Bathyarchaeota archaeon]MCX8162759.1 malate dehydrogenase [Candidatus Bathyarchaeota archaeon]MDW8061354.1 malate dehydrogenase [Nitrososphaerota archaeon]
MKVSVIGVGTLGSCIAYELAVKGIVDELVLVDVALDVVVGHRYDILQAVAIRGKPRIKVGDYSDIDGSDVVIVSAGKPRTKDTVSRMQLAEDNARIIAGVARKLLESRIESTFITLTNPVDVMNYLLYRMLGLPRYRFMGCGCQLDSARFRLILSEEFSLPLDEIEGYVIGEHGEHQIPLYSRVKIGGKPFEVPVECRARIESRLLSFALEVIRRKGATVYGPAHHTVELVESILFDQKRLFCCSSIIDLDGLEEVSIGVPVIVGRGGVEEVLRWDLAKEEYDAFVEAARTLYGYEHRILETITEEH